MSEPKFRNPLPGHPASVPLLQAMNGVEEIARIAENMSGMGTGSIRILAREVCANLHDFLSQLADELEAMNAAARAATEALAPDEARARDLARHILTSRRADQLVHQATGESDAPYFVSTGIGIDQ